MTQSITYPDLRPTWLEKQIGNSCDNAYRWVREKPIRAVMKNPLKFGLPVAMLAVTLGLPYVLSTVWPRMQMEMGGDFTGIPMGIGRWIALTASGKVDTWSGSPLDLPRVALGWAFCWPGRAVNRLTGGWLHRMWELPTVESLSRGIIIHRFAPRSTHLPLEELIKHPKLASLAPRLAGIKPSLPDILRALPKAEKLELLQRWLSIGPEIGRDHLEQAILDQLVQPGQVSSLDMLLQSDQLAQLAPKLANATQQEVLALLAETPQIRMHLLLRLLTVHERMNLMQKPPALREATAIKMLCVHTKGRPQTLHALLARSNLKVLSPRVCGVDPNEWTLASLHTLLSPDERLSGFPTIEILKGKHLGVVSILMGVESLETMMHGDLITGGPSDDAVTQMAFMFGPMAYGGVMQMYEKIHPELKKFFSTQTPAPLSQSLTPDQRQQLQELFQQYTSQNRQG